MLILASIASTLALIATVIAVYSRDVAKTIIVAGIESVFYAVVLSVFLAPDLLIAYIAVGLGANTVILFY
ncbi:MAG: hydrogenase subunit MbhD domain-containing protein, partial [Thermosphaera sp.]